MHAINELGYIALKMERNGSVEMKGKGVGSVG